jgi:hypothetical protein
MVRHKIIDAHHKIMISDFCVSNKSIWRNSTRAPPIPNLGIWSGWVVTFLPLPICPWYLLQRRLGGPHTQSGCWGQETKPLPLPRIKLWLLRSSAHSPVTILTELYWLLLLTSVNAVSFQTVFDTKFMQQNTRKNKRYSYTTSYYEGMSWGATQQHRGVLAREMLATEHSLFREDHFTYGKSIVNHHKFHHCCSHTVFAKSFVYRKVTKQVQSRVFSFTTYKVILK